ncbi:MAG: glycosyltransferase family 2 protein [Thermoplasmatota archaeon]
MNEMKTVSVVIPTLNEAEAIRDVIEEILKNKLKERDYELEIIVVDGGSNDGTVEMMEGLDVKIIRDDDGKADAVRKGFEAAEGYYLFLIDGDGSYPADKIANMVEVLDDGYDMVLGSRFAGKIDKGAMSLRNKIGNKILTWLGNLLYGTSVSDICTGLRGIRAEEIDNLPGDGFEIEAGIHMMMSDKDIEEIPIHYEKRKGNSKLRLWDGFKIGWRLLKGK